MFCESTNSHLYNIVAVFDVFGQKCCDLMLNPSIDGDAFGDISKYRDAYRVLGCSLKNIMILF